MATTPNKQTREERLAAQLRANLKRRKVQAKALHDAGHNDVGQNDVGLPNDEPCG